MMQIANKNRESLLYLEQRSFGVHFMFLKLFLNVTYKTDSLKIVVCILIFMQLIWLCVIFYPTFPITIRFIGYIIYFPTSTAKD